MKKRNVDNLTIEIPDGLDSYNSQYQLKVSNNGNEDVEIKLYLEPLTTENINDDWYEIKPNSARVQGQGSGADFVLTIISGPIINNSSEEVVEEVKLMMVKNTGQTESLVFKYSLIIPPATPENPAISLVDVGLRLTRVETFLNEKQDVGMIRGEIQALQTKIDKLETENASLKQQVRDYQSDIIHLEQTLCTKIENHKADIIQLEGVFSTQIETLKTALQEERTKLHGLLEVEQKRRGLTQDLGSGVTLELVEIPAGKFLMGGVREITLQPFLMGKYPVTQLQWFAIMGNNPSNFKGNNLPVEMVNWHEAREFCEKLSLLTQRKYQLPSESKWEYASRALTTEKYFFGNSEKELEKYAWYDNNSNQQTHPVGLKLANPWGLYDILGNVWEWCQDDWKGSEGYNNIQIDHIPTDGSAYVTRSTEKCLRGGSFHNNPNVFFGDRCGRDIKHHSYVTGLRVVVIL